LRKAVEFFNLAIEFDPSYVLAHCGVADCYNFVGLHGVLQPSVAFSKAKAAALRALELDDTLAEGYGLAMTYAHMACSRAALRPASPRRGLPRPPAKNRPELSQK
jgi:hypothetical protein